jgi:hypothetical protein
MLPPSVESSEKLATDRKSCTKRYDQLFEQGAEDAGRAANQVYDVAAEFTDGAVGVGKKFAQAFSPEGDVSSSTIVVCPCCC